MPGFNQTGPMGQGPMTGRRMGRCTNYGSAPNNQQPAESDGSNNNGNQPMAGSGFGRGRGFGNGWGRGGFGMGRQNRFRGGF